MNSKKMTKIKPLSKDALGKLKGGFAVFSINAFPRKEVAYAVTVNGNCICNGDVVIIGRPTKL